MRRRGSNAKTKAAEAVAEPEQESAEEVLEAVQAATTRLNDDGPEPEPEPGVVELSMGGGYDRIIDNLFVIDVESEYQELEAALSLSMKASRADYGTVVDALDKAEDNARRAMALLVNAKVALDKFEIETKVVLGPLREQAVAHLQELKAAKQFSKTIANDDIESTIATKWPDQWHAVSKASSEAKRMVQYLERLADLWTQRCRSLNTMVRRAADT